MLKKILCILIITAAGCKEIYNPSIKAVTTGYLVVEGSIISGDSTTIHLSRTTIVSDTSTIQPEDGATVTIEDTAGNNYHLINAGNGFYTAAPLNIVSTKNYRLHIFTADGNEYASDFVPVKITPPVDSISWKFDSTKGVDIYVSSHDDANNTLYYLFNYTETWQHKPTYTSGLIYENGIIRERKPDEQITNCWTVASSSSINISSTAQLSADVVYEEHLVNIPYSSEKLSIVYSIQVKEYALTKEAFEFWTNLKNNTENLGTIFDPQPFADYGNIHCLNNPNLPVIGFISASSEEEKRIYIYNTDLPSWNYQRELCAIDTIPPASVTLLENGAEIPLYYIPIPGTLSQAALVTAAECADCRLHGGTTIKPSYMP